MSEELVTQLGALRAFLEQGGPAIWAIAALSVVTLALILWKIWSLSLMGAWSGQRAERAVGLWLGGHDNEALETVSQRGGLRARVVQAALLGLGNGNVTDAAAREETARVAKRELSRARTGLRALELIATIAPLIGLLGTVLGMISAFQALQSAGSRADPSMLAGGIWEALLTTAAGMAVAIPASVALTWFESVVDRVQDDMGDAATRLFTRGTPAPAMAQAAE